MKDSKIYEQLEIIHTAIISAKEECHKAEFLTKDEVRKAISEVKQWEHHDLSEDWEIELYKKLGLDEVKEK